MPKRFYRRFSHHHLFLLETVLQPVQQSARRTWCACTKPRAVHCCKSQAVLPQSPLPPWSACWHAAVRSCANCWQIGWSFARGFAAFMQPSSMPAAARIPALPSSLQGDLCSVHARSLTHRCSLRFKQPLDPGLIHLGCVVLHCPGWQQGRNNA